MNRFKLLLAFCWPLPMMVIAGCASAIASESVILPPPEQSDSSKQVLVTIQTVKIAPAAVLSCDQSTEDPVHAGVSLCQVDIKVASRNGNCGPFTVQVPYHVHADAERTAIQWRVVAVDERAKAIEFAESAGSPIQFVKPVYFTIPSRRIFPKSFAIVVGGRNAPAEYAIYLQWRDAQQNLQFCKIDPIIDNY